MGQEGDGAGAVSGCRKSMIRSRRKRRKPQVDTLYISPKSRFLGEPESREMGSEIQAERQPFMRVAGELQGGLSSSDPVPPQSFGRVAGTVGGLHHLGTGLMAAAREDNTDARADLVCAAFPAQRVRLDGGS